MTSKADKKQYDVIVVGSGAAGGQTAYTLSIEGVKVLMLEAGRKYVPEQETPMFQTADQAPLRLSMYFTPLATPLRPSTTSLTIASVTMSRLPVATAGGRCTVVD